MNGNLEGIKGIILDMDGVLWRGDVPLIDIPGFYRAMDDLGISVIMASNNSTKSVTEYIHKLSSFGAHLKSNQIVNSSMAAGYYLQHRFPQGGPVYIVGEKGLADSLAEYGFFPAEENVLAVVAGLDRHLNYPRLSLACQLIRDGALFLGTNPDKTFPSPHGLTPGAGAVLAFIETATGILPVIAGKPEPYMFQLAIERLGLAPENAIVIGDRLDTDILGGQKTGCLTAVVLSGVSMREEIAQWNPPPDLVLDNLEGIIPLLKSFAGLSVKEQKSG